MGDTHFIRTHGLTFETLVAGDGKDLCLLLHGFPECNFSWRHQLPWLAERGYCAWAPNLRGYGGTDRPAGVGQYTMEKLVGDVDDLIEASGADGVTVMGHDWGGAVAWAHAMYGRRRPDRLVIFNAPHPAIFPRQVLRPTQLRRSWYMFLFQIPWIPEWMLGRNGARRVGAAFMSSTRDRSRFPPEVLRVYERQAREPGALSAMVNYYRGALRGRFIERLRAPIPRITCPTLVVWGEADDFLGNELLDGLEDVVDDVTVERLAGVSHWSQQEAPEAVERILERWLPEVGGRERRA